MYEEENKGLDKTQGKTGLDLRNALGPVTYEVVGVTYYGSGRGKLALRRREGPTKGVVWTVSRATLRDPDAILLRGDTLGWDPVNHKLYIYLPSNPVEQTDA